MKYHNITKDDMLNGDGLRVVLWVSGCEHHCPECQNPITWNPDDGLEITEETFMELTEELSKDYINGITISGGDPFHPKNSTGTLALTAWVKSYFPSKTVWVYTGYEWEELFDKFGNLLTFIDVIVDGRFEVDKKDVNYPWAGSTNQRVIDVNESLRKGEVVLYESH